MGYTTDFSGNFTLNKKLDTKMIEYLKTFNETRRMARDVGTLVKMFGAPASQYGVEGEFFVEGKGFAGQDDDESVIDHNTPPKTQPGLWCQWIPNEDGTAIEWDGGEKFYNYIEWLEYIIANFLRPNGYSITGDVQWAGEDMTDIGVISVKDNVIKIYEGVIKAPKAKTKKPKSKLNSSTVKYEKHMKKLWSLAGEIGTLGEKDNRYGKVYRKLADALDAAEQTGLIINKG